MERVINQRLSKFSQSDLAFSVNNLNKNISSTVVGSAKDRLHRVSDTVLSQGKAENVFSLIVVRTNKTHELSKRISSGMGLSDKRKGIYYCSGSKNIAEWRLRLKR